MIAFPFRTLMDLFSYQGVCIGLNAAIVSIVSEWLGDIKMGYCSDGWWLNQQFCCWEIEGEEVDGCDAWHSWSHVTLARWIIFVLFAVSVETPVCVFFFLLKVTTDCVLVHRVTSCQGICKVCCWVWYIGNKVYSRWFRHAGLPGFRNIFHQECHPRKDPSFSAMFVFIFLSS
jgi:hypothetical protein